jgi:hypothetical protein
MLEWRDLLLSEGGADRDRKVASGIRHEAATLGALDRPNSSSRPMAVM